MRRHQPIVALLVAVAPMTTSAAVPAMTNMTAAAPLLADDQLDAIASDPETTKLAVELQREQLKAQIGRTRFAAAMDDYQADMYRHHQFWTDAAAVAVYIITLFGLIAAAVQFRLIARLRGIEIHDEEISAGAIELPGGAKINSPFLGLLILFLSLGFFYLYLINVYPILSVAEIEAKRTMAESKAVNK